MIRIPTNRRAIHPGEVLFEDFLEPLGLSKKKLADSIRVRFQRINELVSRKRRITPSTALRLAKFFGTTAGFWLNLQMRYDLEATFKKEKAEINKIKRLRKLSS